jgi:hypothetical protein
VTGKLYGRVAEKGRRVTGIIFIRKMLGQAARYKAQVKNEYLEP